MLQTIRSREGREDAGPDPYGPYVPDLGRSVFFFTALVKSINEKKNLKMKKHEKVFKSNMDYVFSKKKKKTLKNDCENW